MRFNMAKDVYEKYIFAGKVAAKAREYGVGLLKSGASYLEIAEKVESKITESGAGLAFPVNISVNEIAAHFSPRHDDKKLALKKGDVVKLDLGSHFEGYIADTAVTVEIGSNKYHDMIKASSEALENAISIIKPRISLFEIGKTVEETINSYGFKPINNLTGHSMQKYVLHAGMTIPNIGDKSYKTKIKVGDVLAIEPFATDGAGHVISGEGSNIYRYVRSARSKLVRDSKTRSLAMMVNKKFKSLPFAERWCLDMFANTEVSLKRLLFAGCIKQYPQLIDKDKGVVTQAEHTVIIFEDGCEVTT